MNKKRGNIFVETIVGVNIILMMFLIVSKLISANRQSVIKRKQIEEGNRIVYCIMQEIKYNIMLEEVMRMSNENRLRFKNYDNLLIDLFSYNISMLPAGNDIEIDINNFEDDNKIELSIVLKDRKDRVIVERSFIKYKWMDYYEKV